MCRGGRIVRTREGEEGGKNRRKTVLDRSNPCSRDLKSVLVSAFCGAGQRVVLGKGEKSHNTGRCSEAVK